MNVAIIQENQINYTENNLTHSNFKRDKIEEDIEEYIKFIQVKDSQNAMETIIEECNFDPNDLIYTTVILESAKYRYYMIHLVDDNNCKNNLNKIGIYLSRKQFRIYGSIGIIKEEIKGIDIHLSKINLDEIIDVYIKCFVHTGAIIDNKNTSDIKYIFNPIDWLKVEEANNVKFIEFEVFDRILMMFIELKPKNDIINEKASIIFGKKINGKVIFALRRKNEDIKQTDYIYEEINKDTIEKLIRILTVKQDEIKETDKEKNNMKIYNFYTIIEFRHNKYVNKYGNRYDPSNNIKKIINQSSVNEEACKELCK